MYGLLAFKRPDPNNPGFDQVAFEIRSYSCFNGFNQQNAFMALRDPNYQNFDLVVSNVNPDGRLAGARHPRRENIHTLESGQDVPLMRDNANWECLGLGVALYAAASNVTFGNIEEGAPTPRVDYRITSSTDTSVMNRKVTTLANINGIQREYWIGSHKFPTRRQFTPNEDYLSNFFQLFQDGRFDAMKGFIGMSRVFQLLARNWNHQSGLYQFVGSERPSGLAVSYLQIWRNTMEKNSGGWSNRMDVLQALQYLYDQYIPGPRTLDVMPILSAWLHNGDDSDIVNFAGGGFVAYSARHGLFNQVQFYRNTVTMLEEGRYNKGGQSDAISRNFNRTLGELNSNVVPLISEAISAMMCVKDGMNEQAALRDLVANTKDGLMWYVTNEPNKRCYDNLMKESVANFERLMRSVTVKPMHQKIQEMLEVISKVPDFRKPAKVAQAVPELSKSPMGFSTWAAQADAPTAEEPVPVAHTIH